jgi:hypothetical protein
VYIYDLRTLRKRKNLQVPEGESREFISLGFSHDSQLLVTLGGAPTWYVYTHILLYIHALYMIYRLVLSSAARAALC